MPVESRPALNTHRSARVVFGQDSDDLEVKPPSKRLIICCDGTWQASNHGTQTIPSNIAKLSHAISNWYVDEDKTYHPQLIYYVCESPSSLGSLRKLIAGIGRRCRNCDGCYRSEVGGRLG